MLVAIYVRGRFPSQLNKKLYLVVYLFHQMILVYLRHCLSETLFAQELSLGVNQRIYFLFLKLLCERTLSKIKVQSCRDSMFFHQICSFLGELHIDHKRDLCQLAILVQLQHPAISLWTNAEIVSVNYQLHFLRWLTLQSVHFRFRLEK